MSFRSRVIDGQHSAAGVDQAFDWNNLTSTHVIGAEFERVTREGPQGPNKQEAATKLVVWKRFGSLGVGEILLPILGLLQTGN